MDIFRHSLAYEYQKGIMDSVTIHDSKIMPCTSVKELTKYKGAFENYARSQNILLSFFDPRIAGDRFEPMAKGSDLAACVAVGITKYDKKHFSMPKFLIVDYFSAPKNFVHHMLSQIQNLVEGDGRSPIEKEIARTTEKLIKAGKIKP